VGQESGTNEAEILEPGVNSPNQLVWLQVENHLQYVRFLFRGSLAKMESQVDQEISIYALGARTQHSRVQHEVRSVEKFECLFPLGKLLKFLQQKVVRNVILLRLGLAVNKNVPELRDRRRPEWKCLLKPGHGSLRCKIRSGETRSFLHSVK